MGKVAIRPLRWFPPPAGKVGARAIRLMYAVVEPGEPSLPIEQMPYLATSTASPYIWDLPSEWGGQGHLVSRGMGDTAQRTERVVRPRLHNGAG